MSLPQNSKDTYMQLSKPYFTVREIRFMEKNNKDLDQNIRSFRLKFKETFQLLKNLCIKLNIPIRILQNSSYFYQRFYLLNNNFKKYSNLNFEVGLAVLFISLKLNDYIKKITIVITEAFSLKGVHLSSGELDENKRVIISLERKILEFQSFDFRNFLIEDFLIKYLKYLNSNGKNAVGEMDNKPRSYFSWCCLNDLYLTSLVLQYPAHYNAIIAIKCADLIFDELVKGREVPNGVITSKWKYDDIIEDIKNEKFILSGCNQLLEYFIDNLNITFIKSCLAELDLQSEDKMLIDLLLNVKIDINEKLSLLSKDEQSVNLDGDLYFQPRDTDIAKNGSIRFLYSKQKYLDEINLYK